MTLLGFMLLFIYLFGFCVLLNFFFFWLLVFFVPLVFWSFCGILLNHYRKILFGLNSKRIFGNIDFCHFVEAFAKTWTEYTHGLIFFFFK